MRLYVPLCGRWIHPDHVTHVGAIEDVPHHSECIPLGTRSYVALTSQKFLYLPYDPATVVAMLEGRADEEQS